MDANRIDRAIQEAARLHAGQVRDGDSPLPYITHPIEVLSVLRYVGQVTDEDMLCAAALHDTLEECDVTSDDIEKIAGRRVRELVVELTRHEPTAEQTSGLSKQEIWELRSRMLRGEIKKMSPDAQTIKLADRLSNLREAKHAKLGEKLNRYVKQTAQILEIVPRKVNPGLWDAIEAEI